MGRIHPKRRRQLIPSTAYFRTDPSSLPIGGRWICPALFKCCLKRLKNSPSQRSGGVVIEIRHQKNLGIARNWGNAKSLPYPKAVFTAHDVAVGLKNSLDVGGVSVDFPANSIEAISSSHLVGAPDSVEPARAPDLRKWVRPERVLLEWEQKAFQMYPEHSKARLAGPSDQPLDDEAFRFPPSTQAHPDTRRRVLGKFSNDLSLRADYELPNFGRFPRIGR